MARPILNDAGDRLYLGFGRKGLTLRPYRDGDERRLALRADFAEALAAVDGALPWGPRWTLCADTRDERPLAIGGLEPVVLEGGRLHAEAWALTSDMGLRAWAFARICAAAVLEFARAWMGVESAGATFPASRPEAAALLMALDFEVAAATFRAPDGGVYGCALRRF